jgi:hypothetical protein
MAIPGQPKPEAFLDNGRVVEEGSQGAVKTPLEKWSIGALKGFEMALQDLKTQGYTFQFRDIVKVTCIGFQRQSGIGKTGAAKDDMIRFAIEPSRP